MLSTLIVLVSFALAMVFFYLVYRSFRGLTKPGVRSKLDSKQRFLLTVCSGLVVVGSYLFITRIYYTKPSATLQKKIVKLVDEHREGKAFSMETITDQTWDYLLVLPDNFIFELDELGISDYGNYELYLNSDQLYLLLIKDNKVIDYTAFRSDKGLIEDLIGEKIEYNDRLYYDQTINKVLIY